MFKGFLFHQTDLEAVLLAVHLLLPQHIQVTGNWKRDYLYYFNCFKVFITKMDVQTRLPGWVIM